MKNKYLLTILILAGLGFILGGLLLLGARAVLPNVHLPTLKTSSTPSPMSPVAPAADAQLTAQLTAATAEPTATPSPTADTPTPIATEQVAPSPTIVPYSAEHAQDYPRVNDHPRDCLKINGNRVCVPLDDSRGMWAPEHSITGKDQGMNYRSDIPAGWAVAYAAASCAVHADGASAQTEYTNTPFIVIIGPWHGSVGCYSGGVHGVPVEWIGFLLKNILPVHQDEAGNSVQPTFIGTIPPEWLTLVPHDIVTEFHVP